jgi:hypothetical protein
MAPLTIPVFGRGKRLSMEIDPLETCDELSGMTVGMMRWRSVEAYGAESIRVATGRESLGAHCALEFLIHVLIALA